MSNNRAAWHMQEQIPGSVFLCSRRESIDFVKQSEGEKEKILKELQMFYTGNIDIKIYVNKHVMGYSVAGDLLVNGQLCRTYDPVDLCFLELNELMLKRMIELGSPFKSIFKREAETDEQRK